MSDSYGALPYGGTPEFAESVAATFASILFLSSREFDRATISASSSAWMYPAARLQDSDPDLKWRTTGKTGQYVNITLRQMVACNALAISGHNLTGAGLIRVTGAMTLDALETPVVDTGWVSAWPTSGKPDDEDWPAWSSLVQWDNDSVLPCWRIDFADPGPTDYIEVGRAWIGRSFQPGMNVDTGITLGFDSPDSQIRTLYGKTFTDYRGAASRRMTLPFSSINRDDLLQYFFELLRYAGLARDLFCAVEPSATTNFHRYSMPAVVVAPVQFEAQPLFDPSGQVWRQTLTLSEPV